MLPHDPITRARLVNNLWFVYLAWPLLTIAGATVEARRLPYYMLSWGQALAGASFGTLLLAPDFIVIGSLFAITSTVVFDRVLKSDRLGGHRVYRSEPYLLFLSMLAGTVLWYPGVIGQSILILFSAWPVWFCLVFFLSAVLAGSYVLAPVRGGRLAIALTVIGVLTPVPGLVRARLAGALGGPPTLAIIGLDSISQEDDVSPLHQWVDLQGGTWYERAVTPGLFTNAVWASILTQKPVREHRIFHTFQHLSPQDATLLSAAKAHGFTTISYFFDQITCAAGSDAGFDKDRSGPMGWRQVLLPLVANNTVLLPVVRPVLPDGWSALRANHSGVFSYSVERSLKEALTSGSSNGSTFVAAHTTYLHSPAYPSAPELSATELARVWAAKAFTLRDRALDWQDVDQEGDPLPLRAWKIRHLQAALQESVRVSGILERGQLIVFSDHGVRAGLTLDNFSSATYHHVVLATFGMPPRAPELPISLIDLGRLAGLRDGVAAEPIVEIALTPRESWVNLLKSAELDWDGSVILDQGILDHTFAGLKSYSTWPGNLAPVASGLSPD